MHAGGSRMMTLVHLRPAAPPLRASGLVGDIIKRFEQRGYKLVGIKVGADLWEPTGGAAAEE